MPMLSRILVPVMLVLAISPGFAALPAAVDGEELPSLAPMLEGCLLYTSDAADE